jgi:hypothetical protein
MSGDGRIGVHQQSGQSLYGTGYTNEGATFAYRTRLHFGFSRESDSGFSISANQTLRFDKSNNAGVAGTGVGERAAFVGGRMAVSMGGATFTMGNTDGAIGNTVNLYGGTQGFDGNVIGVWTANGSTWHTNILESSGAGAGSTNFRLDYNVDALTVSVGADSNFDYNDFAVAYSANGLTLAAGASNMDDWAISGVYSANGMTVGANMVSNDAARIWGSMAVSSTTNVGATINKNVDGDISYSVGATHDLGGATLHIALGQANYVDDVAGDWVATLASPDPVTTMSVGLTFSF